MYGVKYKRRTRAKTSVIHGGKYETGGQLREIRYFTCRCNFVQIIVSDNATYLLNRVLIIKPFYLSILLCSRTTQPAFVHLLFKIHGFRLPAVCSLKSILTSITLLLLRQGTARRPTQQVHLGPRCSAQTGSRGPTPISSFM